MRAPSRARASAESETTKSKHPLLASNLSWWTKIKLEGYQVNKQLTLPKMEPSLHCTLHEKQRQFDCDVCGKSFNRKCHLSEHVTAVHKKERPFECPICFKSFGKNRHVAHVQLARIEWIESFSHAIFEIFMMRHFELTRISRCAMGLLHNILIIFEHQ